ncbi:uncharacterized protein EV422DRAFT_525765 [Fimicolochytrium jonesii]|uniref:uncharacterized protein n=1 Tax=Fimicolochytrium jonesii TaxID=1396493 RepID=UPI0022FEAC2A|nr:uncharacterized protein EV422DRAFT_525765 [Fimicolochytrium jonesii]KAI8822132.1 hypothetical protein EV422DRAFT_525765 [Fimicolochytrium jonesii]
MNGHNDETLVKPERRASRSVSRSRSRSRSRSPRKSSSRRRSYSRSVSRDRHSSRRRFGRSRSRSPSPRRGGPPPRRGGPRAGQPEPEPSKVLGVFGLSVRTTEQDLEEVFSKYGELERITVIYDKPAHSEDRGPTRSRGFGFITFAKQEAATAAREALNGIELQERQIRVDYSLTKRAHSPTPGRYMGRETRDERRGYRGGGGGFGGGYDRGGYDRGGYRRDYDHHSRGRERSYSPPHHSSSRRRSPTYDRP